MTSHTPDPSKQTSQDESPQAAPAPKETAPAEAAPAPKEATPAEAAPAPRAEAAPSPRPTPPKPSALPRPPAGKAAAKKAPTAAPAAPVAPVTPPVDAAAADAAAKFGRVDAEGNVFVKDGETERVVGQFPNVAEREALQLYITRYLDLVAQLRLFETRLATVADLGVGEIDTTLKQLREQLQEPAAVGDLPALRELLTTVEAAAAERRAAIEAERQAAKEVAIAERTKIVEAAEKLAATDPAKIQWRQSGDALKKLLDDWKGAQRRGPRIDKPTEDALWKRFSAARTTFDRSKRHFFADLSKRNAEAKAAKAKLVEEAQQLADSTNWGETARAYRDLMNRWRKAGHAGRKDDDALWAKFRAAQDKFFAARNAVLEEENAEFAANLEVKRELLTEAEALVPVKDLKKARTALRSIQERWDEAGKVPRENMREVESRLRAVVDAVRGAEQEEWQRSNPETRARAEGAAAQLQESLTQLEEELAAAEAAGDQKAAKQAREALEVRRSWMEQISQFASDD